MDYNIIRCSCRSAIPDIPTLGEKLYEHRVAGRFCDVELVPNDSTIGIKCHKLVLMASSEYFSCMFSSGMREASASSVTLADCRSEVLTMLIDFFYKCERPQGVTCDNVLELFSWAIRCDLPKLCEHCWDFIRNSLGPDNAFSVLSFAIAHHLNKIKKECILMIQRQFALLTDAEEWMDLSYETLKDIFSYQMLRVLHEDTVLEILMRWTQRHSNHKDLLSIVNVDYLSQASREKYKEFLRSVDYVPAEQAKKNPSFHVHLMLQYKDDMGLLAVICVTNKHDEMYRYPEISISEYERQEQYRVERCSTHTDGIVIGLCRNLSIFSYNHTIRQVKFCENLQILRGRLSSAPKAAVLDIASVCDQLYALVQLSSGRGPRLAYYLPHLTIWELGAELPEDTHRILDSNNKSCQGVYVLKKQGMLLLGPTAQQSQTQRLMNVSMSLGVHRLFDDCEGLVLPNGDVMVHGRDSAGDFWTCCYDEAKHRWKPNAIRLYHDQTRDDEGVSCYKLFLEGTGIYLIEEWSFGLLTLHQWSPEDIRWNLLKVFKEPRTRLIGAVHRNDCDADTD